ncbi:MAG: pyridoxal-dependent decarboxylase [Thermodesulfobacteriota bacterium]
MDSQDIFEKLEKIISKYFAEQRQSRFVEYLPPDELRLALDLDRPEGDGDWLALFSWVEKYLAYSVKTNHPDFVNRMWVGANLPSVIGEMVAAITNTSSCTYESAPVSTLMEKYMLRKMLDVVGFEGGEGQMTTGSSNANMIAMMAARNLACEGVKKTGLFAEKELFCFVNADAHYSMDKAANILGIGTEHLIKIAANSSGQMDVAALEEAILACRKSGGIPFFVGATAGTTVRGAYDPLPELLELRGKYNFWLHVDGAWGGAVVLSDTLRGQYLTGIEGVDSFTLDFHKMLGTALMCNVFLINRRSDLLANVCGAGDVSYIFREGQGEELYNLGAHSLQCGRRVDSLKWFLDWKFYGQQGFAKRIETYHQLCRYAEEIVENTPELEMIVPRDSFNICFRFKAPKADVNEFNLALRTKLYESGVSLVGYGYIDSQLALRLLITNKNFGRADVAAFFAKLVTAGKILVEEWSK